MGKRQFRVTDDQRRRLAAKAKHLGRKALRELAMELIVRPRQPHIDWANVFDDGGPKFDPAAHRPRIYLIDEITDPIDLHKPLRIHWRNIFEEELAGWMRDADDWPSPRTRKRFQQWFDVEVTELVTDMGQSPL